MIKASWPLFILLFALLIGVVLRTDYIFEKRTILHDEAASYLSSAGRLGEYQFDNKNIPYGRWANSAEWNKLLIAEKPFCFQQISQGLAEHDVHPPLYFWLQHLWSLVFGVHLWTGPSLNVVIAIFASIFLFLLARGTLKNAIEAAFVVLIWNLSPAVLSISVMSRQYDLLALCTILLVWQTIKCTDTSKKIRFLEYFLLTVFTLCGLLTHYQFLIVIVGCAVFMIIRLVQADKSRLLAGLAALILGGIMLPIVHPKFYLSFIIQRDFSARHVFNYLDFISRVKRTAHAFYGFFISSFVFDSLMRRLAPALIWLAKIKYVFVLLVVGGVFYSKKYFRQMICLEGWSLAGSEMVFFCLWISGGIVLFYLSGMISAVGMGSRYLSMAWPFFAFLPIFIFRPFKKLKILFLVVLCVGCLMVNSYALYLLHRYGDTNSPLALIKGSKMIIIDNPEPCVLLCIAWHLPNNKPVFAAKQTYLLERQRLWCNHLDGAVYISDLSYGGTLSQQHKIINLMKKQCNVVPIPGGFFGRGDVFIAHRKEIR